MDAHDANNRRMVVGAYIDKMQKIVNEVDVGCQPKSVYDEARAALEKAYEAMERVLST